MEGHKKKSTPILDKMKDFEGLERWKRFIKADDSDINKNIFSIEHKDILIQKYRSKFPSVAHFPKDNNRVTHF